MAVAERLAAGLGVSRPVGAILARRGFATVEDARAFLDADERHDPLTLPGVAAASELIVAHLRRGSRIAVFGDYDVDGVCSTAILVRTLRALGADPVWELPSRFDEGYGLSTAAVERLAERGVGLLVTVDCGITAVEQVAAARAAGLDVVVSDHHLPGEQLPDCVVVHPALPARLRLPRAVRGRRRAEAVRGARPAQSVEEHLDLAALATVCDLVPLRGENRRIVREGLAALARTQKPGLRALMSVAAVEPAELTEQSLGFRLGPRINAAGRMRRADAALELLLTEDAGRAAEVARELDLLNADRQQAETRILFAAEAACMPQASQGAIVVAGEGWHPGVVGIVASRLVERWRRPCVVIALDEDGSGRGSGRSISAYDLHDGLAACAAHLTRFGGHRMAAGLELAAGAVEPFRAALAAHAGAALAPEDMISVERVDAVVPGGVLGLGLAEELEVAAPVRDGQPAADAAGARRPLPERDRRWGRRRSTPASRWSPPAVRARAGWPSARRPRRSRRPRTSTTTSRCAWSATAGTGSSSRARSCAPSARPSAGELRVLGEEGTFWERLRGGARRRVGRPPPRPLCHEPIDRRRRGLRGRRRGPLHQRRAGARGGRRRGAAPRRASSRSSPGWRRTAWRLPRGPPSRRTRGSRPPTTTWSRSIRPRAGSATRCCARAPAPTWRGARPRPSSPCTCGAPSSTCGRRSRAPTACCASCPPEAEPDALQAALQGAGRYPRVAALVRAPHRRADRAGADRVHTRPARLPGARGRACRPRAARPPTAPAWSAWPRSSARWPPSCRARGPARPPEPGGRSRAVARNRALNSTSCPSCHAATGSRPPTRRASRRRSGLARRPRARPPRSGGRPGASRRRRAGRAASGKPARHRRPATADGAGQAGRRLRRPSRSATSSTAPSTSTAARRPAGPEARLTEDQRVLLGDLFAVVEEHAGDAVEQVDRDLVESAFVFACERHADQRRAERRGLHRAPRRRGQDLRRHAARHRHALRRAAARHGRGHHRVAGRGRGRLRRADRRARGRRDQAVRRHLPEPRRPPGRELPQDDGRDGPGHPGHPDQARRPAAQHAHDRLDAEAQAAGEGEGDARDLRPAGAPARHPRDQVGAGGPRLRDPPPAQVQRDQAARLPAAQRARGVRVARGPVPAEGAGGGRHRGRDRRPRQALLLDLLEDDQEGPRVQRDLRPHGDARAGRLGEGLLRRDRRHPLALEAAARALQGLGRDAQVQHVPGPAHDRDRARGAAARDPDPHARDAPHRRVRRGRALDLQGGRRQAGRAEGRVAAPPARLAAGDHGPAGVRGDAQGRPVRGRGVRLHAQGRGQVARQRRHAARLRLLDPHRRRATAASARRSTARSSRCTTSCSPATSARC